MIESGTLTNDDEQAPLEPGDAFAYCLRGANHELYVIIGIFYEASRPGPHVVAVRFLPNRSPSVDDWHPEDLRRRTSFNRDWVRL